MSRKEAGSLGGYSNSYGCKSSGGKSHGSKSHGSKNHGSKSGGCKSRGDKYAKSEGNRQHGSSGTLSFAHCILKKIGVGTPNIRIHFDGVAHTGIFLGIEGECVILNARGVVSYIKVSSITAVDVGVVSKPKTKWKKHCK
ncbi:hypothetical protein [Paenibacillus sp. NPDC058174]|uniref:hypothetical protein n=1 Tax=Paenibacillus sp. NPDC058174 TaxID=3346366 RepID=UPI0036DEB18B